MFDTPKALTYRMSPWVAKTASGRANKRAKRVKVLNCMAMDQRDWFLRRIAKGRGLFTASMNATSFKSQVAAPAQLCIIIPENVTSRGSEYPPLACLGTPPIGNQATHLSEGGCLRCLTQPRLGTLVTLVLATPVFLATV